MIDYFSIAVTHGLILLACWRLLFRADLDIEGASDAAPEKPWLKSAQTKDDTPDA